jgi:hypothetical protein
MKTRQQRFRDAFYWVVAASVAVLAVTATLASFRWPDPLVILFLDIPVAVILILWFGTGVERRQAPAASPQPKRGSWPRKRGRLERVASSGLKVRRLARWRASILGSSSDVESIKSAWPGLFSGATPTPPFVDFPDLSGVKISAAPENAE